MYVDPCIVRSPQFHDWRWSAGTATSIDFEPTRYIFGLIASVWQSSRMGFATSDAPVFDRAAHVDLGPAAHLQTSLADIQRWLGIGLQQATDAAGISRGTVYAWRDRDSTPRPATVHGPVLRLHGLISSAVEAVGRDGARAWFHQGEPSPLDQLVDARGDTEKVRLVAARLRRALTAPPLPPVDDMLAANFADAAE
ncbi:hypothetical protein [Antrihabitans stalactiti]|uniref:Uncharacterized protein n=1 Tax=Antrihabitans stalactiti TaxID=2584121 RepID=A0A848KCX5_9NOCA|nr:hypothetical protein [Antrihabitans stalactiti]NMN93897.1 hypothetical protein [Antrihabitans stalactiti]